MTRALSDLRSVGPATVRDLRLLGIAAVEELVDREPQELYESLQRITDAAVDICMLDVFCCAVAQARDPHLPAEQREWFWWSRQRKAAR